MALTQPNESNRIFSKVRRDVRLVVLINETSGNSFQGVGAVSRFSRMKIGASKAQSGTQVSCVNARI